MDNIVDHLTNQVPPLIPKPPGILSAPLEQSCSREYLHPYEHHQQIGLLTLNIREGLVGVRVGFGIFSHNNIPDPHAAECRLDTKVDGHLFGKIVHVDSVDVGEGEAGVGDRGEEDAEEAVRKKQVEIEAFGLDTTVDFFMYDGITHFGYCGRIRKQNYFHSALLRVNISGCFNLTT